MQTCLKGHLYLINHCLKKGSFIFYFIMNSVSIIWTYKCSVKATLHKGHILMFPSVPIIYKFDCIVSIRKSLVYLTCINQTSVYSAHKRWSGPKGVEFRQISVYNHFSNVFLQSVSTKENLTLSRLKKIHIFNLLADIWWILILSYLEFHWNTVPCFPFTRK
jgi:hypothetical protein